MENKNVKAKVAENVENVEESSVKTEGIKGADVISADLEETDLTQIEIDDLDEDDVEEDDVVLPLHRETFTGKDKDGKKRHFWTYFVTGEAYGKKVRADFEAADKGGYEVLDIMYDIGTPVFVSMKEEKMTDSKTNQVSTYNTFTAFTIDTVGNVVEYKIKPMRVSDKAIFMMLFNAEKAKK